MKEVPILFDGESIRATRLGFKWLTRRVVDRLLHYGKITEFERAISPGYDWSFRDKSGMIHHLKHENLLECCPYGRPGDHLCVREAWQFVKLIRADYENVFEDYFQELTWYPHDGELEPGFEIIYQADEYKPTVYNGKWRSSLFMPRWAARIVPELVNVRLEKIQYISLEDCLAEGYPLHGNGGSPWGFSPIVWFKARWDSINAKRGYGWDSNRWVWRLEFKEVKDVG